MKKWISKFLMIALTVSATSFACMNVVPLTEVSRELANDFFAGNAPNVVLQFNEGTVLPFKLNVKSEFLKIEETTQLITVLKTCYVKCENKKFLFSSDLQEWKKFKQFFTGSLGVSLNFDEEAPAINLNLVLNQRAKD